MTNNYSYLGDDGLIRSMSKKEIQMMNKQTQVNKLKDISKELESVLETFFTDYIRNDKEYIEIGKTILKDLNTYISQL